MTVSDSTTLGQDRHRDRELDLVLFGATGFTGQLVAEYLVKKRPAVRWALAGRSREKLERVREELSAIDPGARALPIVVADSLNAADMEALARRTRVVCTTAGPYGRYGSLLLGACAANGTDYCDLTGEIFWVREMIDAHHARAVETGARIVPCCGFDSIPSDLGVFLLHHHLEARGKRLAEARFRLIRMKGGASGGSVASAIDTAERLWNPAIRRLLEDPYALNPEGARGGPDRNESMKPQRDPESGQWLAPFMMAPVNTRVVRRSNALLEFAYGRDFRYDETTEVGRGLGGQIKAAATGAGMVVGAVLFSPALAKRMGRFLPQPGQGPDQKARESGFFEIEIHGRSTDGERLRARITADRDPGYGATSRMLAESALCLAEDDLPRRGGILTPASAMGMTLVKRLRAAGMILQVDPA